MARPKKGDRLVYVGKYAHELPEVYGDMTPTTPVTPYPPGVVVRFFTNRFHGPSVTVKLDPQSGDTEDLYADWPISETAPAPQEGT